MAGRGGAGAGALLLLALLALLPAGVLLAGTGAGGGGGGSNATATGAPDGTATPPPATTTTPQPPATLAAWLDSLPPEGVLYDSFVTCRGSVNIQGPPVYAYVRVDVYKGGGVRVGCSLYQPPPGAPDATRAGPASPRWWQGAGRELTALYVNVTLPGGTTTREMLYGARLATASIQAGPVPLEALEWSTGVPGLGEARYKLHVVVGWSRSWLGHRPPGLVGVTERIGPSAPGTWWFYVKNERQPVIQDLWQRAPGGSVPDRDDPDYLIIVYRWDCAAKAWVQLGTVPPSLELKWFQYAVTEGCQARVRAEAYTPVAPQG